MSDLSSPAAGAAADATRYTKAILAALGDRDPLVVMRAMPAALANAVAGVPADRLAHPERPGKWSMLQVLQHLTDSELMGAYRFRLILTADRPEIVGYDQDQWVERLHPGDTDVAELLARFEALRRGNLRILEAASPADRQRYGLHSERGQESVDLMIRLYGGHDLVHLKQLDRIRASLAA